MPKEHVKPSDYLPTYLRLDLNVGVEEAHPFIAALDETLERWCAVAQAESLSMTRPHFPTARKRAEIEGYGFTVAGLDDAQIDSFYLELDLLFREQGSLSVIQRLGRVYFGESLQSVRRGRGLERKPLKGKLTFPLVVVDREDSDRSVLVSLARSFSLESRQEFIGNCERLLPTGFRVLLRESARESSGTDSRISLAQPFTLVDRRL